MFCHLVRRVAVGAEEVVADDALGHGLLAGLAAGADEADEALAARQVLEHGIGRQRAQSAFAHLRSEPNRSVFKAEFVAISHSKS